MRCLTNEMQHKCMIHTCTCACMHTPIYIIKFTDRTSCQGERKKHAYACAYRVLLVALFYIGLRDLNILVIDTIECLETPSLLTTVMLIAK